MHPAAKAIADSPQAIEEMLTGAEHLWDSVLRTGLLPRWDFSPDNLIAYDISGPGKCRGSNSLRTCLPEWKSINTDEMYIINVHQKLGLKANIPRFNGVALSTKNYLQDLIDGFTQMYRFLREKRQTLLEAKELLTLLFISNSKVYFSSNSCLSSPVRKDISS